MGNSEITKIPYDERTDDQKLESNWKKAKRQFEREDWSACVIRAATSAEIAANIYIRHFLQVEHDLPPNFVDALLMSANGLDGKFKRLIKPAAEHLGTWPTLKTLQKKIESLNNHRNGVAHAGKFKSKKDTKVVLEQSLAIIAALAPNEAPKLSLPFES
ncbi:hypothetical protein EIK76_01010 [Rheinheimera mesophila]|uniref:RiboL-PSP-HEPN domain-containing protein n=1 Tax=Rheinheimera mesophila TaxID=1547515 RepID=A0A3P3QN81_9GAMM|nr:hypothetical protein [Rheinheimera mesophila]KKL01486.1 hypothetical protein SD53_09900 [Rheinheimera mesophila]RRJ22697.1 hypothetical protein EIK76_01010 [Rheinheimera mesophila]